MSSSARRKSTGEPCNAADFYGDSSVDPFDFVCQCGAALRLCSYLEDNIPDPYFRFLEPHAPGCPSAGQPHDDGPSRPSAPVIDQLVLRDLAPTVRDPSRPDPPGPGEPDDPGDPGKPRSGRSVATLRRVVEEYSAHPELASSPLRVRGASARTYGSLFQVLSKGTQASSEDLRIYYGKIQYTSPVLDRSHGFEFTFHHGDANRRFRLFVSTERWKPAEVAATRKEIDKAVVETRAAGLKRSAAGLKTADEGVTMVPWVFFLGKLSEHDPSLFVVDHPGAVCTWPLSGPNMGRRIA